MSGNRCVIAASVLPLVVLSTWAAAPAYSQDAVVRLGRVSFDPPFVEAAGTQQVLVDVQLLDASGGERSIALEELIPLAQGDEEAVAIATLRDDGTGVDHAPGDGVFSARVRFERRVCGLRRLRVSRIGPHGEAEISPPFTLPSALPYLATAEFVAPYVLPSGEDDFLEFDAGEPGELLLTVAAAAPLEGSNDAIVDVRLDGASVVTVKPGEGCIEQRIRIGDEAFRLDIENDGFIGDVAVRLDALANRLALRPTRRPSNLTPSLGALAEAEVTAQGAPVLGAEIVFQLQADEETVEVGATTESSGRATADFPFKLARAHDRFELGATLLNGADAFGELYNDVFEDRAPLALSQTPGRLVLKVGEEAVVDLAIRLAVGNRQHHEVELLQDVLPTAGLALSTDLPPGGLTGTGPAVYLARQRLSAREPGSYSVFTEAVLNGHDAFATSELLVEVVPEDAGGALVIYKPSSQPAILEPDAEADVVFKVAVAGVDPDDAPESLVLEQMGDDASEITNLTDDDGDLVYTGSALLSSSQPERRQFRVSATGTEQEIHSALYTFEFGFLPDRPVPPDEISDFGIVEESATGERFAADQLLIKFRDEVSPERIETIVGQEEAGLVGFLPLVDVVQVVLGGDGSPEDVRRRIASFETYAEVEYAEPDHEVVPAAYPNDPLFTGQAGLASVGALEAWLGAGGAPQPQHLRNIAILDTGVDLRHPDLAGRVVRVNGQVQSENCVVADQLPPQGGNHGTAVAGIAVAAISNGSTIAGAAPDAGFVPVQVLGGASTVSQVVCGLTYVIANRDLARIANLSLQTDARSRTLRDGIEEALLAGVLVVAAAGNGDDGFGGFVLPAYPAAFADVRGERRNLPENGLVAVANVDDQGQAFKGNATYAAATHGSRQGPWVDLAAPGVAVPTTRNNGGDMVDTGTSFSAPLVAGAASLLWSRNPGAPIEQVEAMLKRSSTPFTRGTDQIGDGVLSFGGVVMNGGIEIDAAERSPAAWPGIDGSRCRAIEIPAAGNRGFFRARGGRRFLLCGSATTARTEKILRVPGGVAALTASVQLAGIVFGDAHKVRLRAYLVQGAGQTLLFQRRLSVDRDRCGTISATEIPAGPKCSKWKAIAAFEANSLAAGARIRFEATPVGGAGPVFLLIDDFRIDAVP